MRPPAKAQKIVATMSAVTMRALESVQGKPAGARGSRAARTTADQRFAVCQVLATVSTRGEKALAISALEARGHSKQLVYRWKREYDAAQAKLEGGQLTADVFVRKLGRQPKISPERKQELCEQVRQSAVPRDGESFAPGMRKHEFDSLLQANSTAQDRTGQPLAQATCHLQRSAGT